MGKEKGPRLDIGVKIVTETNYKKCDENDDNDDDDDDETDHDDDDDDSDHDDDDLCS